jgi:3-methyladenine DNA glycosylase AlkD
MNLIKDNWTKQDIEEFNNYLYSLRNEDKMKWSKNILQTNMNVLAMKTKDVKDISREISKGNYISFLDYMPWNCFENTSINGFLITNIKDFNVMKKYLDIYSSKADNWASCDLLSFDIKDNEDNYMKLLNEYIKSDKPFVRRIGIVILFKYVGDKTYLKDIFKILNSFYDETEYYVNMINAWLVCECFIKHRDETIEFLNDNKLNKFTINKAIQKCRDSFRVSKEDKEMLLKYKR